MTVALSSADLLRLRMRAQLLAGPGAADVAEAARHMFAVQGQDWRSSRWALGLRAPGATDSDVLRAFDDGLVVRAWPMRGTLHVVPAEDIGWIQRATNHRVLPGAPKRRDFLGLSVETLDRMVEAVVDALTGGRSLDRNEADALWAEAGIERQSSWRYHVLWWMCQNGITAFGPVTGPSSDSTAEPASGEPRLVLAEEWIRSPRRLEGDEALAEIAARYAGPRGAVTARDLAWWTGLTVREAKQALVLAAEAGRLEPVGVELEGSTVDHWASPKALDAVASEGPALPEWKLLPSFDEHLLGYTDRSAQLDPEYFDRIVPGRNGMFLATVLSHGRVVGTWKRSPRKRPSLQVTPFPGQRIDGTALVDEAARWAVFYGGPEANVEVDVLGSAAA